ncbi:conserved Plasmodium protein, unknown function [Plasmodium chabaudi chabaudi]|uniref:Uncharacterized protein n=1 Tax=Plasmodium chabaudi chabaudi TaxID=31271 RepID=A0A1C6YS43_PLACU|nr:conserved Plasmodium protein, unknown function [Plasmodium chabaudi chabaudi]
MNFFSNKLNIRSTKSEVIRKPPDKNEINSSNAIGSVNNGSNSNTHLDNENGKYEIRNSTNGLYEDNNQSINGDIDKKSEIYYCNNNYDMKYMYMNKMNTSVASARNHTSTHSINSSRNPSINFYNPKVARTSNIPRNFEDKLPYSPFYSNVPPNLESSSMYDPNESCKSQGNSQIVEQSIELLKHLIHQESRDRYYSGIDNNTKNNILFKLADQVKKHDDKQEAMYPDYISNSSNYSMDMYKKKVDMLNLKFAKLKNEYASLNNENAVLKKQIRYIKDNYNTVGQKSLTSAIPRGLPKDPLKMNGHSNMYDYENKLNNNIPLNPIGRSPSMYIPEKNEFYDNTTRPNGNVFCDGFKGKGPLPSNYSSNNVNEHNINENQLNKIKDEIRKELRSQIRNEIINEVRSEIVQQVTNQMEKKYNEELNKLRAKCQKMELNNIHNNTQNNQLDTILNNCKNKLSDEINDTVDKYKSNIVNNFKESLKNMFNENEYKEDDQNNNDNVDENKQIQNENTFFNSVHSFNNKINECINIIEEVETLQKNMKTNQNKIINEKNLLFDALNNINSDINDIDNIIYNINANLSQDDVFNQEQLYPDDLDLLKVLSTQSFDTDENDAEVSNELDYINTQESNHNVQDSEIKFVKSDEQNDYINEISNNNNLNKKSELFLNDNISHIEINKPPVENNIDMFNNLTNDNMNKEENSVFAPNNYSDGIPNENNNIYPGEYYKNDITINGMNGIPKENIIEGGTNGIITDVNSIGNNWNNIPDEPEKPTDNNPYFNNENTINNITNDTTNNNMSDDIKQKDENVTSPVPEKGKDKVKAKWKSFFSKKKKNVSNNLDSNTELWTNNENGANNNISNVDGQIDITDQVDNNNNIEYNDAQNNNNDLNIVSDTITKENNGIEAYPNGEYNSYKNPFMDTSKNEQKISPPIQLNPQNDYNTNQNNYVNETGMFNYGNNAYNNPNQYANASPDMINMGNFSNTPNLNNHYNNSTNNSSNYGPNYTDNNNIFQNDNYNVYNSNKLPTKASKTCSIYAYNVNYNNNDNNNKSGFSEMTDMHLNNTNQPNNINYGGEPNRPYNMFYNMNNQHNENNNNPMGYFNGYNNQPGNIPPQQNNENTYNNTMNIKRISTNVENKPRIHTTNIFQNNKMSLSTKSEVNYNSLKSQKNTGKKNLEDLFA